MKKLLTFTLSVLWLLCFVWFSNATTSDCQSISYAWWNSICISINKNWNTYTLSRDITCPWGWCSLSCKILLPDNTLREVWACNGDFTWNWSSQWLVKIYAQLNDTQKTVERNYNFSAWSWWNVVYENTNLNNFYLSTNKTNPNTSQRVDLTIKARNSNNNILTNYTNRVKFDVYYRTSTSSSWNKTSSSYYYTINPNYTNWYKFISSDYGQKNLYDFIRFNKNNLDYKVRVYDENNSNIYNDIYFYVGSDSSVSTSLDNFYLSTNKTNPSTSQRVDLTIKARNSNNNILTNYTNRVKFDVYYRTSTSSSWNKTSSSYYYTINPNYTNWYKFISSDYGQKNLYDFIRFNKNNLDYKVRVYDENNSNIYNDIYFYVNTAETNSNIAWFTVKEVEMIQRIYNIRPQLIRQLKAEHPRFNTNTIWKNLWNDLYSNMKDVLDNKTWRKFTNYSKFFSDFMVWYNRTMDVIH